MLFIWVYLLLYVFFKLYIQCNNYAPKFLLFDFIKLSCEVYITPV